MAASNSLLSADAQPSQPPAALVRLFAASRGEQVGLSLEEFLTILNEIVCRYLPSQATEAEQLHFLTGLQLEELALARACAKGIETAWDRFVERYRPKLRNAARAIVKDEAKACELADSLYADLFGTRQTAEGARVSKLASYTGRGSLEGWLRTVLAQEYVNQIRRERRMVAFDERIGHDMLASEPEPSADDRVNPAIQAAFAQLAPEERVLLASYYLDGRTLAEIARMLGKHESTISRRINKTTAALRKKIVRRLRELGMSAREAGQAIESGGRGLAVNLRSLARSPSAHRSHREAS